MSLLHIFTDIPILIVITSFIISLVYCIRNYVMVRKNLLIILGFIQNFSSSDLSFRFKEMDEFMRSNSYISTSWLEFKNTLVFSESVALKGDDGDLMYQDVSSNVQNIQTTVDPLYFFNDETLVTSKYNAKLLSAVPTILTGFGPLFTFLNIATAFGKIDFSTQERTIASVAGLMSTMQIAALVSVIAVGSCLIFTIIDKVLYGKFCNSPLKKIEEIFGKLFENVSSENFLFELLRETKIQNNEISKLIAAMPNNFKTALNTSIASNLVPYLENLIFGINQMNKTLKETAKSSGDAVDDLF